MSVTMRGNLDGTASILVGTTEAVALDSVGNFTVKGGVKDLNIGVLDEQSLTTNGY